MGTLNIAGLGGGMSLTQEQLQAMIREMDPHRMPDVIHASPTEEEEEPRPVDNPQFVLKRPKPI